MTTPTPTDRIAEHAVEAAYDDLPADVLDRLKRHLLDHIGLAIGAREHAGSSEAIATGIDALASGGDEATALATGDRYGADHAALYNGTFAHSLDFDDTHRESSLHPGAPVIPAALAIAERDGATTEEFLAAVSVGYDVACTLGQAVNPDVHYDRGFHITATCGTFGATAAAGKLAGLSVGGLKNALGINGSQAAGSLQFLANGAWNKRLHPGLAANRAVTAVTLADAGFRGATDPITGTHGFFAAYTDDPAPELFDRLGDHHSVMTTGLKLYPCCRYMHPALDGLLDLAGEIDPEAVESVAVELPRPGVRLTGEPIEDKRRPSNFVNCQFSMPYGVALALTTGEAGLEAFLRTQDSLEDAPFSRLMDVTTVETTDAVQSLFPDQWAARVTIETTTDTHERFVKTARGEPEKPLDWAAVIDKFESLTTTAGVSDRDTADIVEMVQDLESRSVPSIVDQLRTAVRQDITA
ncbi:MAG: MmgE/PrpD family protein [Halobacteriales archaeon]